MTKKEFKEKSSIHTYGTGSNKWNVLYFGHTGKGYSIGVIGRQTKARLLSDAYDMIIKGLSDAEIWYYFRVGEFKVPIALKLSLTKELSQLTKQEQEIFTSFHKEAKNKYYQKLTQ